MALKDLTVLRETIQVSKTDSFTVRGLSLHDLAALLEHDYDTVASLFTGAMSLDAALKTTPKLIHLMIAHCADEPEEVEKVAMLPIGVQIEALVKLWELSTLDPDEVGNVVRGLIGGVQRFGDSLGYDLNGISSETGSGLSKSQLKRLSTQGTGKKKSSTTPSPSS